MDMHDCNNCSDVIGGGCCICVSEYRAQNKRLKEDMETVAGWLKSTGEHKTADRVDDEELKRTIINCEQELTKALIAEAEAE